MADILRNIAESASMISGGLQTASQVVDDPSQLPIVKLTQQIQDDPTSLLTPKCESLRQRCENLQGSEYEKCMVSYRNLCE